MPPRPLPKPPSPKRLSEVQLMDFRGGLRISVDPAEVKPNELADCCNVIIDHDGGIRSRGGVTNYTWLNNANAEVRRTVYSPVLNNTLWFGYNNSSFNSYLGRGNAADPITTVDTAANTLWRNGSKSKLGGMNDAVYYVAGSSFDVRKITNSALTTMTASNPTWQDDYASPSGSHFPRCTYAVSHMDYMFAIGTYTAAGGSDGSGRRVRFSHPGDPGSWRSDDWFDIPDGAGPAVSMGDHLLFMTSRGLWALYGNSPETFSLVKVVEGGIYGADDGGLFNDCYELVPGVGLFLWSRDRGGLWLWNGRRLDYKGEKVLDGLREGHFGSSSYTAQLPAPRGMCFSPVSRLLMMPLYYSVTASSTAVLTYDVDLEAYSLWKFNFNGVDTTTLSHNGAVLQGKRGTGNVMVIDEIQDVGMASGELQAYIETGWLEMGTINRKGWKRLFTTVNAGRPSAADGQFSVSFYKDYSTTASKTVTFDAGATHKIQRLSGAGVARALKIKLTFPSTSSSSNKIWSVDKLTMQLVNRGK